MVFGEYWRKNMYIHSIICWLPFARVFCNFLSKNRENRGSKHNPCTLYSGKGGFFPTRKNPWTWLFRTCTNRTSIVELWMIPWAVCNVNNVNALYPISQSLSIQLDFIKLICVKYAWSILSKPHKFWAYSMNHMVKNHSFHNIAAFYKALNESYFSAHIYDIVASLNHYLKYLIPNLWCNHPHHNWPGQNVKVVAN